MNPGPVPGYLAPLYLNTGSYGTPTWTLIANAKGTEISDSRDKVDISAQYSEEKKYIGGQRDYSLTFDYQYFRETIDAVFDALDAAYQANTPVEIAEADGPIAEAGTVYSRAFYIVTKLDKKADLGGSLIYSLELAPTIGADGVVRDRDYTTVT